MLEQVAQYIMKIFLAIANFHTYNLAHGIFKISKVITQKFFRLVQVLDFCDKMSEFPKKDFSYYNYLLKNFDPWKIIMKIKEFHNS